RRRLNSAKSERRREPRRQLGALIVASFRGVNGPTTRADTGADTGRGGPSPTLPVSTASPLPRLGGPCDRVAGAGRTQAVIARQNSAPIRRREAGERRLHPRPGGIAMDMGEGCLHPGNELLAVEQLADADGRRERAGIATAPGARAEVGIEVGGGGDAAG